MNSNLAFFEIEGQEIRKFENLISVLDVLKVIGGQKNPRAAWNYLRNKYPGIANKIGYRKLKDKNGRLSSQKTPMASEQVVLEILVLLPGEVGDKYREKEANIFLRYLKGDITLANEILERVANPNDPSWQAERKKGKKHRKDFVSTLADSGIKSQRAFSGITNNMTLIVTGKTATQLKAEERVAISREVMTETELNLLRSSEHLSTSIIKDQNLEGYNDCFDVSDAATRHIMDFAKNYKPVKTIKTKSKSKHKFK